MAEQSYRFPPIKSTHVENSRQMIVAAASAVAPGDAIVLGAGRCEEIPLAALADRFAYVTLNDTDRALIDEGIAAGQFSDAQRAKLEIVIADITGQTELILKVVRKCVEQASDVETAIAKMSDAVSMAPEVRPTIRGAFELIVASCVLSQLHVGAVQGARAAFLHRFADQEEVLSGSPLWQAAVYQLARAMEARLMTALVGWLKPGGRIFLSESVQMCQVELTAAGDWSSPGWLRMTKSTNLLDYLDDRFQVEAKGRWPWVVHPPQQAGERGRLFDVQAVILSTTNTPGRV